MRFVVFQDDVVMDRGDSCDPRQKRTADRFAEDPRCVHQVLQTRSNEIDQILKIARVDSPRSDFK